MTDTTKVLEAVDIMELMKLLPHRYPFLLVDRIVDIDGDSSATGIKNVTVNEPHFQGHFPDQPVMPGVLIVEAMAQTAGAICIKNSEIKVRKVKQRGSIWRFACEALVDGGKVAEADISAMMSFKPAA